MLCGSNCLHSSQQLVAVLTYDRSAGRLGQHMGKSCGQRRCKQ